MDQFERDYLNKKLKDNYYTFNEFQAKHSFNFRGMRAIAEKWKELKIEMAFELA